jgi:hypothetical protein
LIVPEVRNPKSHSALPLIVDIRGSFSAKQLPLKFEVARGDRVFACPMGRHKLGPWTNAFPLASDWEEGEDGQRKRLKENTTGGKERKAAKQRRGRRDGMRREYARI